MKCRVNTASYCINSKSSNSSQCCNDIYVCDATKCLYSLASFTMRKLNTLLHGNVQRATQLVCYPGAPQVVNAVFVWREFKTQRVIYFDSTNSNETWSDFQKRLPLAIEDKSSNAVELDWFDESYIFFSDGSYASMACGQGKRWYDHPNVYVKPVFRKYLRHLKDLDYDDTIVVPAAKRAKK